jgi:hypothetical protein
MRTQIVCSDPNCNEDIEAAVKELLVSKHHSPRPWSAAIVCSKGHKTTVSPALPSDPTACCDPTCREDIHVEVEQLLLSKQNSPLPWKTYVCCSKDHKTMVFRGPVTGPGPGPVPVPMTVAVPKVDL